jgi:hypothetical protein
MQHDKDSKNGGSGSGSVSKNSGGKSWNAPSLDGKKKSGCGSGGGNYSSGSSNFNNKIDYKSIDQD